MPPVESGDGTGDRPTSSVDAAARAGVREEPRVLAVREAEQLVQSGIDVGTELAGTPRPSAERIFR
jgi:hypothetical protein